MKIKPLLDNVVLVSTTDKKNSSIILPSGLEEKPDVAEVYAVGSGGIVDGKEITIQLKVGDRVLYNKYAGSIFEIKNQTFTLIKQTDILAIIEQ